jgi:hypothetical protein
MTVRVLNFGLSRVGLRDCKRVDILLLRVLMSSELVHIGERHTTEMEEICRFTDTIIGPSCH